MSQYKNRSRSIARDRFWSDKRKSEYSCPDCGRGRSKIQGPFEVHHKDGDAYNNSMENLVGLCPLCHKLRENKKPSTKEVERLRDAGATSSVKQELPVNDLFDLKEEIRTACLDDARKFRDIEPSDETEKRLFNAGYAKAKAELRKRFEQIIKDAGGVRCSYCGISGNKADGLRFINETTGDAVVCSGCEKTYAWKNQDLEIHASHIEAHPKKNTPHISPSAETEFKKLVALLRSREFGVINSEYRPGGVVLSYITEQYLGVSDPDEASKELAVQAYDEMELHEVDWSEETIE
jgi:DNA-directed RNA polymerase subunit RPC12/RpoP